MRRILLTAAPLLLFSGFAFAQGEARTCRHDLAAFDDQLAAAGFDAAGPAGADGVVEAGVPPVAPPIDPGRGAPSAPDQPATERTDGPWAAVQRATAPTTEIRTLTAAAAVLAARGNEPVCAAVLAEARGAFGAFMREHGDTAPVAE